MIVRKPETVIVPVWLVITCVVMMVNFPFIKSSSLPTASISTLTGGGSKIGDGMAGNAIMRYPHGIALGLNNELLVADCFNHRVRKVSYSGDVSTVAGIGSSAFSGDGGLATSSEVNFPYGVVVNSLGETFIADSSNHVIRKVSTNGKISTIAGTASTSGYSGDGTVATSALLNSPYGLTINSSSSEIIIVDTGNHVIRKVSSIGNITTIAGTGSAGNSGDNGQAINAKFNGPRAAFYSNGDIYIADTKNHKIRKVSSNGVVTTIAGTGTAGYNGDSILAKNAQLNYPSGISVNSNNEIYISDTFNSRVRKILTNGTIITIAGTGVYGWSGDGSLATSAQLFMPAGIVVNSANEILVSDSYNHRIRKISTSGIISTFAGTSSFGDGVQSSKAYITPNGNPIVYGNNLVFADNGKVRRVDLTTNVISTLTSVAPFSSAVGYYNSEVYVMYLDSYLSKVKTSLTSVSGTGAIGYDSGDGLATSKRLQNPSSVFVTSSGDAYFSDSSNHKIRKLSTNGYITTIAGSGVAGFSGDGSSATSAKLNNPKGLVVNSAGEVFFSDNGNHRIRKVSTGGIISTVVGTGESGFGGDGGLATAAKLDSPHGIALNSNNELLIADLRNNRIRKVSTTGYISTVAGNGTVAYKATFSGDNGLAINAQLYLPFSVAVNLTTNDIFITDSGNHRIRKVSSTSGIITTIAGTGTSGFSGDNGLATNAKLNFPFSISVGNSEIYFSDQYNQRIRKIALNGYISTIAGNGGIGFNGDGLAATSTSLNYPSGVSSNSNGEVFIVDTFNSRIRKVSSGKISTVAGGLGDGSSAVNAYLNSQSFAINSNGEIYIADAGNHRIRKISTNGDISTVAGSGVAGFSGDDGLATSATLNSPSYVAVNSNGEIVISDSGNNRIRKVSARGIITTIAGNGTAGYSGDGKSGILAQFNNPSGLVISSSSEIYIADSNNHRIRKLDSNGTISTSVGTGIAGLSGDGSLPTSAQLNYPTGLAITSGGELYISDDQNNRIRKVSLSCQQGETLTNGLCEKSVTPTPSSSTGGGSTPQPSKSSPKTSGSSNVSPSKSQRVADASLVNHSLLSVVMICMALLVAVY